MGNGTGFASFLFLRALNGYLALGGHAYYFGHRVLDLYDLLNITFLLAFWGYPRCLKAPEYI